VTHDPYSPPQADAGVAARPGPMSPWWLWSSQVPPLLTALALFLAIPQFREVFEGFGAELPILTKLAVQYPWLAFAWPLAVFALGLHWRRRGDRGIPLLAISLVGSFVVLGLGVVVVYLPVFKLAATI
jgi:hypothetical protein